MGQDMIQQQISNVSNIDFTNNLDWDSWHVTSNLFDSLLERTKKCLDAWKER